MTVRYPALSIEGSKFNGWRRDSQTLEHTFHYEQPRVLEIIHQGLRVFHGVYLRRLRLAE